MYDRWLLFGERFRRRRTGRFGAAARSPDGSSGVDFSILPGRPAARAGHGRRRRWASRTSLAFFGAAAGRARATRTEKARPRYVMDIDFWQAIRHSSGLSITRYDVCGTCHGSGSGSPRGRGACAQCQDGHVAQTGRGHEVQPDLPALRRSGIAEWRARNAAAGPRNAHRDGETRIPPARASARLRVPARATPEPWERPLGDLYITTISGETPFFPPRGRDIEIRFPSRCGSGAGRQNRGAHHRWPPLLKSPGTTNGRRFRCARRAF